MSPKRIWKGRIPEVAPRGIEEHIPLNTVPPRKFTEIDLESGAAGVRWNGVPIKQWQELPWPESKAPEKPAPVADEVELTPDEQDMLAHILGKTIEESMGYSKADYKTFDSLYGKLVD